MKASRSLLISCLLVVALGHSVAASNHHYPRQLVTTPSATLPTTTPPTPTPSAPSTTPSANPPSPVSPSPSPPTTDPSPTPSPQPSPSASPPPDTDTTKPADPTTTSPPAQVTTPINTPSPVTEVSLSTDASGVEVTVTITSTPSVTSETTTPSATETTNESSGLGIGPIIGMSVAGGVAVIAIIAFFVWKFSKKRRSDFDDGEAIKWPDLNTHGGNADSHPLPVHNTGRSGFDTGSEVSLSRVPSSSNYSTPDIPGGGHDPYAVPPLPHMNPNQPYRDDPAAATGYYDPYRGPVPGTLEHGAAAADDWAGEAIPMTQMANPHAGRMSPGAQAAYGGDYDPGRRSPGPQAAYGRTSPGAQVAYGGGRVSPGPQVAYGGRASPGPNTAYAAGRMSPGPQAAYDPYGTR
ncbi:hypothetical protein Hypma_006798 [Hypsizygus marmoreus]|uniref:Uncharacterized protein n=1 Tax=Hypsizygus marmoreus TaxID=39966 RepID=A0A369K1P4_HYPMA|nr:hypothetical protein Hypma_006798 [Hypsizygus marmoreus]